MLLDDKLFVIHKQAMSHYQLNLCSWVTELSIRGLACLFRPGQATYVTHMGAGGEPGEVSV